MLAQVLIHFLPSNPDNQARDLRWTRNRHFRRSFCCIFSRSRIFSVCSMFNVCGRIENDKPWHLFLVVACCAYLIKFLDRCGVVALCQRQWPGGACAWVVTHAVPYNGKEAWIWMTKEWMKRLLFQWFIPKIVSIQIAYSRPKLFASVPVRLPNPLGPWKHAVFREAHSFYLNTLNNRIM